MKRVKSQAKKEKEQIQIHSDMLNILKSAVPVVRKDKDSVCIDVFITGSTSSNTVLQWDTRKLSIKARSQV